MQTIQQTNTQPKAAPSIDCAGFFYIDGIPTKGLWVDLLPVRSWDDVKEKLEAAFPDSVVDEILCSDIEGYLVKPFYTSCCDAFSMDAWAEFADDVERSWLDLEVIEAYADNCSSWEDVTISNIEDSYIGQFDSDIAFAEDYAENCCIFDGCSDIARNYFDYEAYWKCELRHYFYESNGYYFRNL